MGKEENHTARQIFALIVVFCLSSASAFAAAAQKVTSIRSDGTVVLEGGRLISFAGIRMSTEAIRMLPALLARGIEDFKEDRDLKSENEGPVPVYLFVITRQVDFPVPENAEPEEEKVMLNELLIEWGAAQVREDVDFKLKDRFLRLQEIARENGRGIWSYQSKEDAL